MSLIEDLEDDPLYPDKEKTTCPLCHGCDGMGLIEYAGNRIETCPTCKGEHYATKD